MNKAPLQKILDHPDKDEIISKMIIGSSVKDIYEWLKVKYSNISETKFVISEKHLNTFKDTYLDVYNLIQKDMRQTKAAIVTNSEEKLILSIQKNSAYKEKMLELADKEIDIRKMVATLCVAIESRTEKVFNELQSNPDINPKLDRLLISYAESLGMILDKYYKFTEVPVTPTIQHNVTLQVVDQHISVFHDVIKEVLAQMDVETSLYFMEVFNEKMAKLKPPSEELIPNTDIRLAETKILNETIHKRLA
jgi:hypothetical protein